MPSANLELVRSIFASWERGNWSAADWADPNIEYVRVGGPSPGTWTGPAGMAQEWRDVLGAWEDFHSEAEEYRELDDERVLVVTRFSGRGKTSGLELGELRAKGASLFHIQKGKVTRLVAYLDRERALTDLGLKEKATSANLDLVRSIFAAWERGDFSSAEWADPEIEFVIAGGPSPGSWTGVTRMAEGHRDWMRAWEDFRVEADEYRELDDDRVLVLTHLGGRGKTSGVSLDQVRPKAGGANLFEIRDGKVTRLVLYMDSNSALADLGLKE